MIPEKPLRVPRVIPLENHVAEGPKIFDVQCIWGKIFVSLEKNFVFKHSKTIFHLVFM